MIRLLRPQLQRFAWGSPTAIPQILGIEVDGSPLAEAWYGESSRVAPGPLQAETARPDDGEWPSLGDLVADDPDVTLGEGEERFPFLVKFLAAAWPLSIQVHPTAEQAREGFERENRRGIPLDAPERIYRDPNPKPEAIVALEPFQLLAGFRTPGESAELLDALAVEGLRDVADVLRAAPTDSDAAAAAIEQVVRDLCTREAADLKVVVADVVAACQRRAPAAHREQCAWVARLGGEFPGDVGVVLALLMNHLHLAPFDAAYVPEGMVHSYLVGSGLEVMGNSDNVVRGGLTIKPVHVDELLRVLDFRPGPPPVVRAGERPGDRYEIPADAFALDVIDIRTDREAEHETEGPEIIVTLDGLVSAEHDHTPVPLARGAAAFVGAGTGDYRLAGQGTVARITLPR